MKLKSISLAALVLPLASAAGVGLFAPMAVAQRSGQVTVDVSECIGLESADERRACYARQVDSVVGQPGTAGADTTRDSDSQRQADPTRAAETRQEAESHREAAVRRDAEAEREPAARHDAEVRREAAAQSGAEARREADRRRDTEAAAAVAPIDQPARSEQRLARDAGRASNDSGDEEEEFLGRIADLQMRVPNRYAITLEDGQVWEQVAPKPYPLRPGMNVRIYPSRWGSSYRLTAEEAGNYIQVRRIR